MGGCIEAVALMNEKQRRSIYAHGAAVGALALLVVSFPGCAKKSPPPPAVIATASASSVPTTATASVFEARWLQTGGATKIGAVLSEGTLVLMGGRRALVRADGSVVPEKAAAPEPLANLTVAATRSGPRILGVGYGGLYRMDEALGAATLIASLPPDPNRLGVHPPRVVGGPGFVELWVGGKQEGQPEFVDVETGKTVTPGGCKIP